MQLIHFSIVAKELLGYKNACFCCPSGAPGPLVTRNRPFLCHQRPLGQHVTGNRPENGNELPHQRLSK